MTDEECLRRIFKCDHLPPGLREVVDLFCGLSHEVVIALPFGSAERSIALQKILEAKDIVILAKKVKMECA